MTSIAYPAINKRNSPYEDGLSSICQDKILSGYIVFGFNEASRKHEFIQLEVDGHVLTRGKDDLLHR